MWCELVLHIAGAEEVEAAEESHAAAKVEAANVEAAVEVDAVAAEFEVDAGVSQEIAGILAQILSGSLKEPTFSSLSTTLGK